jgi:hypothetical protein
LATLIIGWLVTLNNDTYIFLFNLYLTR